MSETGFPAEHLVSDPNNACYTALKLRSGFATTFLNPATPYAILARLQKDGARELVENVLPRWKPWLPPRPEQGLQQGGAFVFRGSSTVLAHYDEATGAHVELTSLLRAAGVAEKGG